MKLLLHRPVVPPLWGEPRKRSSSAPEKNSGSRHVGPFVVQTFAVRQLPPSRSPSNSPPMSPLALSRSPTPTPPSTPRDRGECWIAAAENGYEMGKLLGFGAYATVRVLEKNGTCFAGKFYFFDEGIAENKLWHRDRELAALRKLVGVRNVAQLVDCFGKQLAGGRSVWCTVTDLALGGDLFDFTAVAGAGMSEDGAQTLARAIFGALVGAHERGVVHGDVKPENVYFGKPRDLSSATLGDLGLSEFPDGPSGIARGTLDYMAPEVARGGCQSARSDVWSAALTCLVAFVGEHPYQAKLNEQRDAPTLRTLITRFVECGGLQKELKRVGASIFAMDFFERTLAMDPDSRPTAKECIDDFWLSL